MMHIDHRRAAHHARGPAVDSPDKKTSIRKDLRELVWIREIVCANTISRGEGLVSHTEHAEERRSGENPRGHCLRRSVPTATGAFGARTREHGDPADGILAGNGCFEAPSVISVFSVRERNPHCPSAAGEVTHTTS